jgi:hypothetical protein
MKKQKSIDYLIKECSAIFENVNNTDTQCLLTSEAIYKARNMHEIEITEAFEDGNEQGFICKTGEQYYNETYKKEEK